MRTLSGASWLLTLHLYKKCSSPQLPHVCSCRLQCLRFIRLLDRGTLASSMEGSGLMHRCLVLAGRRQDRAGHRGERQH